MMEVVTTGAGDNWSYKMCITAVNSSPLTN